MTQAACLAAFDTVMEEEGLPILGWRDLPVDNSVLGESVRPIEPRIRQIFVGRGKECADQDAFERKLFVVRKQIHHAVWDIDIEEGQHFYIPSMSTRTIVYKGMMLAEQGPASSK